MTMFHSTSHDQRGLHEYFLGWKQLNLKTEWKFLWIMIVMRVAINNRAALIQTNGWHRICEQPWSKPTIRPLSSLIPSTRVTMLRYPSWIHQIMITSLFQLDHRGNFWWLIDGRWCKYTLTGLILSLRPANERRRYSRLLDASLESALIYELCDGLSLAQVVACLM